MMKTSKLSSTAFLSERFAVAASILIVSLLFILSCSKDGKDGLPGTNGKDGASILSGTGAPAGTLGKEGDFYLDKTLATLYGPKTGSSWGTGMILTGEPGAAGNTILSGTGAPASGLGVNGDFYIDRTAKSIYGPKSVSGWGSATSMVGPAGSNGTNGTNGTNADVRYTNWFTANGSGGTSRDTTVDGTCMRIRHQHVSAFTSNIVSSGLILVYMRVGSIGPYTLPYISDAGGATNSINFIINVNKVFLLRHTFNTCRFNSGIPESFPGQPVLVNLPQSLEYRIIIIPGITVFAASKSLTSNKEADSIKGLTYEEVCEQYNIPD